MSGWTNFVKSAMEAGKNIAKDVNAKASAGEVFHDNSIHMKMFGGKDIDIIPDHKGALLQVSGLGAKGKGDFSISMDKQEYNNFLSLKDELQRKSFVENFLMRYAPDTYRDLKKSETNDDKMRRITQTPWDANGQSRQASGPNYVPLNPRITHPEMHGNQMTCEIDGHPQVITIGSKQALDAFYAGQVTMNQLANKVLHLYDNQQMALQGQVEMGLDAQRSQDLGQSAGMRRM